MCPLTARCREARVSDPARELRSRTDAKHSWSGLLGRISPERLAPGLVLELDCGSGADSIVLAEQGFTVLGLHFSTTAITGVCLREGYRDECCMERPFDDSSFGLSTYSTLRHGPIVGSIGRSGRA